VQRRSISLFFQTTSVCAVVAIAFACLIERAAAQPFLTVYAGPGFDGTNGYLNPSFHQDDIVSRPAASWALLNNAGMAAWLSDFVPTTVNSYALRSNPFFGTARLADLAGPPITPASSPLAINAFSQVVGQSLDERGRGRPVRWDVGSAAPNVLAPLEYHVVLGPPEGQANDVNDSGVSVGWSGKTHSLLLADLGDRAVRWDAAGNPTELGNISSYTAGSGGETYTVATSEAYSINNVGTAVGYGTIYEASGASKGNRAVRWNAAGVATELGHLGTSVSAVTNSAAWAINEAGAAVGFATKFDAGGLNDGQRAVRWNAGSTAAIELQVLGAGANGSTFSKAYTLNENGTAVGWLDKYDGQGIGQGTRAVVWNPAGQVTELGLIAGASSSKAFDINNLGTAVGLVQAGEPSSAAYWNANGSAVDLNTLIAPGSGWRLEQALAISDTGWVAGIGKFDDGPGGAPSPYDRVFMMQVPIEVALPGDYNVNGEVDAADYVIWRERMATLSTLPNDTTPGWVQPVDYSVWRANFSRTAGIGSAIGSTSVPEPASFACAAIGVAIIMLKRRPRRRIER
jgi:hypothetical protein